MYFSKKILGGYGRHSWNEYHRRGLEFLEELKLTKDEEKIKKFYRSKKSWRIVFYNMKEFITKAGY
jgi:nucleoside diphosphate kinase